MVLLRIFQQVLTIGKILVLARFLAPYEFGIFGICLLTIEALNVFTQTGFNTALVQRQEDPEHYLNAAWTAGLIRGGGLFLILVLVAPSVMAFFDGNPTFEARDLVPPRQFIQKLKDRQSPAARCLFERFDSTTQDALQQYNGDPDALTALEERLVTDLNRLLNDPALFDPSSFPPGDYSKFLQRQMAHPEAINDIKRFNRRLLEETFDREMRGVILDRAGGTWLLRVMALTLLLSGFQNIGVIAFIRELQFNKYFIQQLSATLADVVVFTGLVIITRSVWALVIGQVVSVSVSTIMGYWIHPYRPRWNLDFTKISHLWGYGKWIFGITVVGFLIFRTTDVFIGKLLGPAALGLYQMAFRIALLPIRELSKIVGNVTFPGYAKIQNDLPRLHEAYYKATRLTTGVSFPLICIIGVLAPSLTKLFFASAWQETTTLIQVLVLMSFESALFMNVTPLLQAINKQQVLLYGMGTRLILTALLLYFVTERFGILGACWLSVGLSLGAKTIVLPVLKRATGLTYSGLIRQTLPAAISTCLLAGCLMGLQYILDPFLRTQLEAAGWLRLLPYLLFFLAVTIGLAVYFLINWKWNAMFRKEFKEILVHLVKPL